MSDEKRNIEEHHIKECSCGGPECPGLNYDVAFPGMSLERSNWVRDNFKAYTILPDAHGDHDGSDLRAAIGIPRDEDGTLYIAVERIGENGEITTEKICVSIAHVVKTLEPMIGQEILEQYVKRAAEMIGLAARAQED